MEDAVTDGIVDFTLVVYHIPSGLLAQLARALP